MSVSKQLSRPRHNDHNYVHKDVSMNVDSYARQLDTRGSLPGKGTLAKLSHLPSEILTIQGSEYDLYNVPGDGNCFFHALSIALKGLAQAKIIKKSVILFRVLNMTI